MSQICLALTKIIFLFFSFLLLMSTLCSIQIELKTAPADFRFPTTNQTRHCFTRYIEFHRFFDHYRILRHFWLNGLHFILLSVLNILPTYCRNALLSLSFYLQLKTAGVWEQSETNLVHVRNLPNTIGPFALVNGCVP